MNEVLITKIKYNNNVYEIYLDNGKYIIKLNNDIVNDDIASKIIKIINNNNILIEKTDKYKINVLKKIAILSLYSSLSVSSIVSLLDKEPEIQENQDFFEDSTIDINESIADYSQYNYDIDFDLDFYKEYVSALYSNDKLNDEQKKLFLQRYNYVNKNLNVINKNEVLKILKNIVIITKDEGNNNVEGQFEIVNGVPTITLFNTADNKTLIHEIYHSLHYNEIYWDNTYYYKDKFIGSDEYNKLDETQKKQCISNNSLGILLEEAYTTINTIDDTYINLTSSAYNDEVIIYKLYDNIIGTDKMNEIMLSKNHAANFMNALLDIGYTKAEAVATMARLDLFDKFIKQQYELNADLSYLRYQICNDIYQIYKKNNFIDDTLKLSIISFTQYCDISWFLEAIKTTDFDEDYIELITNSNKILLQYVDQKILDKYPEFIDVSNISLDYFNYDDLVVNLKINGFEVMSLLRNDNMDFKYFELTTNDDNQNLLYQLYTDYYEYAMNQFDNNQEFASFFASVYANQVISADEKGYVIERYEVWKNIKNKEKYERDVLMQSNYETIINFIDSYESYYISSKTY